MNCRPAAFLTGIPEKWMNYRGSWNGTAGAARLPPVLLQKPEEKSGLKEPLFSGAGATPTTLDAKFALPVCSEERGDIEMKCLYEIFMNPEITGSLLHTQISASLAYPVHCRLCAIDRKSGGVIFSQSARKRG